MKIWDLSINKPVTVFMGLVCLLVLGAISLSRLKLAFLPMVDIPEIEIHVTYPDQSPDYLEKQVTRPLEEAVSTLKGVRKISSDTSADGVEIELEFDWGKELDLIRLELGLKIEEIKPTLPEGIRQIAIYSFNSQEIPVVQGRLSAPGIDLSENYDLLEKHVIRRLERVPGVAKVELGGVYPKEISIELHIDKLNAHGVDPGALIRRLQEDNLNLSSGKIKTNGLVYNVRSKGRIETLEAFENLTINDRGLLLSDIADVRYEEPPVGYRRHLNGNKALALEVFKESTANTVEVAHGINAVIENEIATDPLLKGLDLLIWQDQAREITNGLKGLTQAGLYGALFAVLVLFLFLRRISATLIVATAIPISIVGSFIALYLFGYTLNILTMMGLMLAVGMLVDNAVVVLESIYQKSQSGLTAVDATREGTREVVVALIAATSTTLIVFLSLVISDGDEVSVWLGAVGLTICMTLATSLLVSTTVIPLFTSKLLKRSRKRAETVPQKEMKLVHWYGRILDTSLRRPVWTFVILLLLVISVVFPFSQLSNFKGTSFRNNRLWVSYQFHDFFYVSDVADVAVQVEAAIEPLRQEWGIKNVYTWMAENNGATAITFENDDISYERYKEVRAQLRELLPTVGGVSFVLDADDDDGGQTVRVQLFGIDTEPLKKVRDDLVTLFGAVPGLHDVRPGEKNGKKELVVSVDREQANAYGVHPEEISQVFSFLLGGIPLPRFQQNDRETDVTLGLRIEDRATIQDISEIRINNGIKLGALARFEVRDRPGVIRRVDRKSFASVMASYEGDDYSGVLKQIEAMLDDYRFPPGVTWSWSSRMIQEDDEMAGMAVNLLLALILVYLVMASLFESFTQPFMIFSTIVFSLVGVSWFLYATRTEFGLMVAIGMLILVGIVVNNGIILMDKYNQLRRKGMSMEEAVRMGARDRIRPILMTAATTVIGLVPMAIGSSGVGNAYYFPLARCVIGGLTSSTLLTLVGLPFIIIASHKSRLAIGRFFRWCFGLPRRLLRFRPKKGTA